MYRCGSLSKIFRTTHNSGNHNFDFNIDTILMGYMLIFQVKNKKEKYEDLMANSSILEMNVLVKKRRVQFLRLTNKQEKSDF